MEPLFTGSILHIVDQNAPCLLLEERRNQPPAAEKRKPNPVNFLYMARSSDSENLGHTD